MPQDRSDLVCPHRCDAFDWIAINLIGAQYVDIAPNDDSVESVLP